MFGNESRPRGKESEQSESRLLMPKQMFSWWQQHNWQGCMLFTRYSSDDRVSHSVESHIIFFLQWKIAKGGFLRRHISFVNSTQLSKVRSCSGRGVEVCLGALMLQLCSEAWSCTLDFKTDCTSSRVTAWRGRHRLHRHAWRTTRTEIIFGQHTTTISLTREHWVI